LPAFHGSDERIDVESLAITTQARLDVWVGAIAHASQARACEGRRARLTLNRRQTTI
jgi:hypothetical protein